MNKDKKIRYRYDLVMEQEDYDVLNKLRNQYAINISRCFKIFLKKHLEKMEKSRAEPNP
jgi:hypothetical protein